MSTKSIKLPKDLEKEIIESILKEGRLRLVRIGIFELRTVKSRKLFHNFSDKIITIRKHKRLHFKPSLSIRNKI